jgi:eukaryotic-like serine/threonine-protein kinase
MPEYEKLSRLGAGNFGEVWLVFDKALGVHRAVKYVPTSRIVDPTEFYREPRTLMCLQHENIARVEDAGKESNGSLYIAMEYLKRGSIEDIYKGRPVTLTAAIHHLCDVCWGLEFAHQKGYVHRDIKPANVLLTENGKAKLSDFGLATRVPKGGVASPYGYLTHLAPEVFNSNSTSVLTDVYALGVTAYRLINGDSFLPSNLTIDQLYNMVLEGTYPDRKRYRPYVPRPLKFIVNKAMHTDSSKRFPTASEFRKALETIAVNCNWSWKYTLGKTTYRTKVGQARIKLCIEEKSNSLSILRQRRG